MRKTCLFPAVVLALFLALGFAIVWGVLVKLGYETVRSFGPPAVVEEVFFLADGTPVVERMYHTDHGLVPLPEPFRDLAGNPVRVPDDARWALGVPLHLGRSGESVLGWWLAPEESWFYRIRQFGERSDPVTWYLLCDGRRHGWAYFVAYDRREYQRLGYLGTAGFRAGGLPPEERFPFNGSDRGIFLQVLNAVSAARWLPIDNPAKLPASFRSAYVYLYADNDTIYQIDLNARDVRVALAGRPIKAAGLRTRLPPVPDAGRISLVVRTDDAVLELDEHNQLVRRFPIPEDLRHRDFAWIETASGDIVTFRHVGYDFALRQAFCQITWFDAAGHPRRREETDIQLSFQGDERVLVAGMLAPVWAEWHLSELLSLYYVPNWASYGEVLRYRFAALWPTLLLVHAAAVGLAWLTYRRLVRYRASRAERVAWPVFVLILGWPGWVGFRFARSWPVLESCSACGIVVPRDRIMCAACRVDFPLPARLGTEVFA